MNNIETRPWQCPTCGARFETLKGLTRHVKCHPIKNSLPLDIQPSASPGKILAPKKRAPKKSLLVFKAQPEGFDKNDSNWKGDVTNAPGLKRSEIDSYDPRVDVAFSTKAWMNKQVCEYDVQRILDKIGENDHGIHRKFIRQNSLIYYCSWMVMSHISTQFPLSITVFRQEPPPSK